MELNEKMYIVSDHNSIYQSADIVLQPSPSLMLHNLSTKQKSSSLQMPFTVVAYTIYTVTYTAQQRRLTGMCTMGFFKHHMFCGENDTKPNSTRSNKPNYLTLLYEARMWRSSSYVYIPSYTVSTK